MKAKILIIDDDYSFAEFAKYLVEQMGCSGVVSRDGERGISAAVKERPDLILIDAGLGRMSGIDVIRRLKADDRTKMIPILLCSVTRDKSEIKEALTFGAIDYIPKPLNQGELRARIGEALSFGRGL